ncbi:hypothetical protein BDZ45DRAFT_297522 [Acephala macrosclerotiorum]|nr:hypothetical protein BDZ45DRAFT_297522 [Acephala macrosclerotiorum]
MQDLKCQALTEPEAAITKFKSRMTPIPRSFLQSLQTLQPAAPASSSHSRFIANRSLDSAERGRKTRSSSGSDAWLSRPVTFSTSNRKQAFPIPYQCSHTGCTNTNKAPKPLHENRNRVGFKTARRHSSPQPPRNQREELPVFPLDSPTDTDAHLGAMHQHHSRNDFKAAPFLSSPHPPRSERGETAVSLLANLENTENHLKDMHEHHGGKKIKAMHRRPAASSASGEESQRSLIPTRPASPVISTLPRTEGNRGKQEGSRCSSNSAMAKAPTEFIFFLKLPTEIRLMIWDLALPGPRVIEILCEKNVGRDFYTKSTTPILLHVNQESRALAFKFFQKFTAQKSISRDTEQFMHSSVEAHEDLVEDLPDGTVIERGAK